MQEPNKEPKALITIANVLSGVFSPLLIPTYAYAIALWTTPLIIIPEKTRFISCGIIFLITTILPLGVIIFLMKRGVVSDAAISKPSERRIPYIMTILCYFLAALYLHKMPDWLSMFFAGAGIAAIIDSLINIKWKISAHATAMGGLCALVAYIGINHLAIVMILPWLAGTILISGLVGSARILLKRHTPGQVYAGWAVGLVVSYLCMCL